MDTLPRWVLSKTSRNAHLDLGERSGDSLRVYSGHIVIVTACRAHIDATAAVVPESHQPKCSNCMRIVRQGAKPKAAPQNLRIHAWFIAGRLVLA